MMRAMDLVEIAAVLGLAAPARNARFTAVATDSRTLAPGSLFVALAGERFDGHAFVAEAERRGPRRCCARVPSRPAFRCCWCPTRCGRSGRSHVTTERRSVVRW